MILQPFFSCAFLGWLPNPFELWKQKMLILRKGSWHFRSYHCYEENHKTIIYKGCVRPSVVLCLWSLILYIFTRRSIPRYSRRHRNQYCVTHVSSWCIDGKKCHCPIYIMQMGSNCRTCTISVSRYLLVQEHVKEMAIHITWCYLYFYDLLICLECIFINCEC